MPKEKPHRRTMLPEDGGRVVWSGYRESNSEINLGKVSGYLYIIPALFCRKNTLQHLPRTKINLKSS